MKTIINQLLKLYDFIFKNFLYQRKVWIENFRLSREGKMLRRATKLADLRHKADGKRYYVLPDFNGDLRVLNSKEIDALKRAKVMDKQVSFYYLINESLYHTQ